MKSFTHTGKNVIRDNHFNVFYVDMTYEVLFA